MEYWKKKIYLSRYWKEEIRPKVYEKSNGICFFCGKLILKRWTCHHKIELTEQNYMIEEIAFGLDNLVLCHSDCHNQHHERFGFKASIVENDLEINYGRRKV